MKTFLALCRKSSLRCFKECSIEMSVNPGDNKSVTLLPHGVTIKQSLDMVLFTITDYDLVNATDPKEGCIAQPARYQLDHLSQTFSWLLGTGEEGCLPDS